MNMSTNPMLAPMRGITNAPPPELYKPETTKTVRTGKSGYEGLERTVDRNNESKVDASTGGALVEASSSGRGGA